jgi:hypothetical protein
MEDENYHRTSACGKQKESMEGEEEYAYENRQPAVIF